MLILQLLTLRWLGQCSSLPIHQREKVAGQGLSEVGGTLPLGFSDEIRQCSIMTPMQY